MFEIKKTIVFVLMVSVLFLTSCASVLEQQSSKSGEGVVTKFQCLNGQFVDDKENCPVVEQPKSEIIVKEKEVMKYQCLDGSIKNKLSDCKPIEVPQKISDEGLPKKSIDQKIRRDVFEFTLESGEFDGNDYKVEFTVKNIGREARYFQPQKIALLDKNNNQYDVEKFGPFPISPVSETLLPGVTKQGYWIFHNVPKTSEINKFYFEIGFTEKEQFNFVFS